MERVWVFGGSEHLPSTNSTEVLGSRRDEWRVGRSPQIFFLIFQKVSPILKKEKRKGSSTLSSAWSYGLVSSFTAANFKEQLSVPTDSTTALSVHISPCAGCSPLSSITQQKGVSIRSQIDLHVDKSNRHFAALILLDFSAALDTGWPLSPWMLTSLGFPDTKLPSSISLLFLFYFLCRQNPPQH